MMVHKKRTYRPLILFIGFFLISLGYLPAQCEIWDLHVDHGFCKDGKRNFFINFNHTGTSDSFHLTGNGINYGTFAYQNLPLTLQGIEPPCGVSMEWVITDQHSPMCHAGIAIGNLCCDCSIYDLTYTITPCDPHDNFTVELNFEHDGVGTEFILEVNGTIYGTYQYDNLPISIGPFEGDCTTNYRFLITDKDNPDCKEDFSSGVVCCGMGCDIRDLAVEILECNGDSCYELTIDFIHEETSDRFTISDRHSLIGIYTYSSLPLTIECFPISGLKYELIKICDVEDPTCCRSLEFESKNCTSECFTDFVVEAIECDSNNTFYVEFGFGTTNPGDSGYYFMANGRIIDTFDYDSSFQVLGPFHGGCDSIYSFRIFDVEYPHCTDSFFIERPCCNLHPCELDALRFERTQCDSNQMFDVWINFNHARTQDSFVLFDGHDSAYYAYSQLPVRRGPFDGDCATAYHFKVKDKSNDCISTGVYGPICCDSCVISHLVAEAVECNGDSCIVVHLDFEHSGTQNIGFDVFDRTGHVGFYSYDALPLTIECFPISGHDFEYLRICDNDNPHCCAEIELPALDCAEECHIRELIVEPSDCDSNGLFRIDIDFHHQGTSDSFYVRGNGHQYGTFSFDQLPLTIDHLVADCSTHYEFVVLDTHHPDCRAEYNLGTICCDSCVINHLVAEAVECNGDSCIVVHLDFEHSGTQNIGFDVFDRTGHVGFYSYDALPLTIECFPISGHDFEYLRICDNDNPHCCAEIELPALDCESTGTFNTIPLHWDIWYSISNQTFYFKNMNYGSSESLKYCLYDLNGKPTISGSVMGSSSVFLNALPPGVYLLNIQLQEARKSIRVVIPN